MNRQKRRIGKVAEKIKEYNEKRLKLNTIDTVVNENGYEEIKKISLSTLLNVLNKNVFTKDTSDGLAEYSIQRPNGDTYKVYRNMVNIANFFSTENFLANFNFAFKYSLQKDDFSIKVFSKLKIEVEIDCHMNVPTIAVNEMADFRFLTCMLFGLIFNIKIIKCSCHPTSFEDFVLFDAGVSKNCISSDCKNLLLDSSFIFDPLLHFTLKLPHIK